MTKKLNFQKRRRRKQWVFVHIVVGLKIKRAYLVISPPSSKTFHQSTTTKKTPRLMQYSDIGTKHVLCVSQGSVTSSFNNHTTFRFGFVVSWALYPASLLLTYPSLFSSSRGVCSTCHISSNTYTLPPTYAITPSYIL